MPLTRSRKYNRRIQLEVAIRASNGAGGWTKTWAPPVKVWAEMIPLRGGEALDHLVLKAQQLWKVTIRYRADVDADARIEFKGKKLNIRSCEDPAGDFQELVMTCEAGVNT